MLIIVLIVVFHYFVHCLYGAMIILIKGQWQHAVEHVVAQQLLSSSVTATLICLTACWPQCCCNSLVKWV